MLILILLYTYSVVMLDVHNKPMQSFKNMRYRYVAVIPARDFLFL